MRLPALLKKPIGYPLLMITALGATFLSLLPLSAWVTGTGLTKAPSFPTDFRGDWYGAPGPCDRDPQRLALHIDATTLNYFDEFSGRLTRVIRRSDRTLYYAAEYSADGHRWNDIETLRLSPKGSEMTLEPERTSARYFRCTVDGLE